jgi:DNA-binding MarR family transcriptional regulator
VERIGEKKKHEGKEPELIEIHHENPALRSLILLAQTSRMVSKYIDSRLFRRTGISQIKFIALLAFDFYMSSTDGITASQLAKWTDTEPHNITTLIGRMKREGLLSAERSQKDKRYVNIRITDKGKEVIRSSMSVAREIVDQIMSSIRTDDFLQLEKTLKVIRKNSYDGLRFLFDHSRSHL